MTEPAQCSDDISVCLAAHILCSMKRPKLKTRSDQFVFETCHKNIRGVIATPTHLYQKHSMYYIPPYIYNKRFQDCVAAIVESADWPGRNEVLVSGTGRYDGVYIKINGLYFGKADEHALKSQCVIAYHKKSRRWALGSMDLNKELMTTAYSSAITPHNTVHAPELGIWKSCAPGCQLQARVTRNVSIIPLQNRAGYCIMHHNDYMYVVVTPVRGAHLRVCMVRGQCVMDV
jgi:hypothetical protein